MTREQLIKAIIKNKKHIKASKTPKERDIARYRIRTLTKKLKELE